MMLTISYLYVVTDLLIRRQICVSRKTDGCPICGSPQIGQMRKLVTTYLYNAWKLAIFSAQRYATFRPKQEN